MSKINQKTTTQKINISTHKILKFSELKHYKISRKIQTSSLPLPSEIKKLNAISTGRLPKTLRAYLEVSVCRNGFSKESDTKSSTKTENSSETEDSVVDLYCNCKRPYQPGELMFRCDGHCQNWYHPQCLNMKADEIDAQKYSRLKWFCPKCLAEKGNLAQKKNSADLQQASIS